MLHDPHDEPHLMRLLPLLTLLAITACQPDSPAPPPTPAPTPAQEAPVAKDPVPKAPPKAATSPPPGKPRVLRLNFNELARAAYARDTMAPAAEAEVDAVWNAAFHLRGWNILGDPASKRVPPDLIFEERGGKKWLMAFTDNKRLHDYASQTKRLDDKGTSVFVTMPNPQIVGFLRAMKTRGVHGVHFNEGPFAWAAPIDDVLTSYARLKGRGEVR